MANRDVTSYSFTGYGSQIMNLGYYIHPTNSKKYFTMNTSFGYFLALEQDIALAGKSCIEVTDCINCFYSNCATYWDFGACKTCDSGYSRNIQNGKCELETAPDNINAEIKCEYSRKCQEGCMYCNSKKKCEKCKEQYTLDQKGKYCQAPQYFPEDSLIGRAFTFFIVICLFIFIICTILVCKYSNDRKRRTFKRNRKHDVRNQNNTGGQNQDGVLSKKSFNKPTTAHSQAIPSNLWEERLNSYGKDTGEVLDPDSIKLKTIVNH